MPGRLPSLRESLPRFVEPMLLSSGAPPGAHDGVWAVEVKFDGIRAQLRVDGGRAWSVRSRQGRDCSHSFSELASLAATMGEHEVLLDGELVQFGSDGRPDFSALRRRLTSHAHPGSATFVAFDVLHLDGYSTRELSYARRREILTELYAPHDLWRLAPSWIEQHEDVCRVTREHELEGVVFKRLSSTYRPGRRTVGWRKVKHRRDVTLTITAWTPGNSREPDTFHLARIVAPDEPRFAGSVQLGLSGDERDRLRSALHERELEARRHIRIVAPGISVVVSTHGPVDGPLRDAILREFSIR